MTHTQDSSLARFLAELGRLGVEFQATDGKLQVTAPKGVIDAALAAEIGRRKADLIAHLAARGASDAAAVGRVSRDAPLALGYVQQRMWLHNQIEPDTVLYNLPAAWRLSGALDAPALERALNAVVARHEVLRMRVHPGAAEPMQSFDARFTAALPLDDLSGLDAERRQSELMARLGALRDARIDLEHDAPFRTHLFRLAAQEHVFFFMPHHVVWDGWSFDIFLRDLNELYLAETGAPSRALPALPVQYADYAVWHRQWLDGGAGEAQTGYWLAALQGQSEPLDMPTDFDRPRLFSHRGDWETFDISSATVARINHLATAHRATSFMVLLAAWYGFLSRISGQRDIVVGAPIQARQVPEVADLIGCFVNTLCLRQRIDPDAPFVELLEGVREMCLQAYEHQDAPVNLLVDRLVARRDPSRTPLFQAMFSHQQVSRRPRQLGTLTVSQVHVNPAATPTELMLAVMEGAAGARGVIHYSTDLFTASSVRALRQRFEQFVDDALSNPTTRVRDLQLLAPGERSTLLEDWNDTTADFAREATLTEVLARQAGRTPRAVALRWGEAELRYGELEERANRLANVLRSRGVGRGALVGLCLERSLDMVVAQLAILKSGAAYVPLDPAYPAERLAYMAGDAQLRLLVTQSSLAQVLAWPREASLWLDSDAALIAAAPGTAARAEAQRDARAEDPAYVIYTSGSTGQPKGVAVPHRAVVNFLASMAREPGLQASDKLVAVTTLSFDIAVLELLLPLSVGAEIVLASRDQAQDGLALRTLLEASGATVMQATPSTWRMLIEAGWSGAPGFKALIGGEGLPLELAEQLLDRSGALWNMYGPTETTVWSTCWKVEQPERGISIGRPIANTCVHVLDEAGQLCPIGVPGEIHIGGEGVALGYLERAELTAQRFIANPFASSAGSRLYRTGDRGRWRHDGLLQHMGRLDDQVKVRGHRIELGEIEANLVSHAQVAQAVVMVREDRPGDVRLVAYLVGKGEAPPASGLRSHLRMHLPEYMLPQHFVLIDVVPLLPNGKINRAALPAPGENTPQADPAMLQQLSEAEKLVARLWSEMLGVVDLRAADNFFDLGGHSLLAIQATARMQRELGLRIPLRRLIFENLGQIAATTAESDSQESELAPTRKVGLFERLKQAFKPARDSADVRQSP